MIRFFDHEAIRRIADEHDIELLEDRLGPTLEGLTYFADAFEEGGGFFELIEQYKQEVDDAGVVDFYKVRKQRNELHELKDAAQMIAYLKEVSKEAVQNGLLDNLRDKLAWLDTYGSAETRVYLSIDSAPHSFGFTLWRENKNPDKREEEPWVFWFNGGLIYHGPHDRGGDGGAPTFSVNLNPTHGWQIHT